MSLETTNVYAEIDLEMKANALAKCEVHPSGKSPGDGGISRRLWTSCAHCSDPLMWRSARHRLCRKGTARAERHILESATLRTTLSCRVCNRTSSFLSFVGQAAVFAAAIAIVLFHPQRNRPGCGAKLPRTLGCPAGAM